MSGAFLLSATLLAAYWVDTIYAAIFTIGCLPTSLLQNRSPFEVLFEKMPNYQFLKPFGCACFPDFVASSINKLKPRYVGCVSQGMHRVIQVTVVQIQKHIVFDFVMMFNFMRSHFHILDYATLFLMCSRLLPLILKKL